MMAPGGKSDDGRLDLCIVSQVSRLGILKLIPRFMAGTQATHPAVRTEQADQITITALEGGLPAHADGETICTDGKELIVELLPHQIELVCDLGEEE